jgi:hypothetical protein
MILDSTVSILGKQYEIASSEVHSEADVGIVTLKDEVPLVPGLAWGVERLLGPAVMIGYASVPQASHPVMTMQRTEINGGFTGIDREEYILLSSIARPGDSGGPVVSLTGKILGIVTRSLERQREEADHMSPMPFFAAVPAKRVVEVVRELRPGVPLPIEDHR